MEVWFCALSELAAFLPYLPHFRPLLAIIDAGQQFLLIQVLRLMAVNLIMIASPLKIGERLRSLRKEKGYSIDDLSEMTGIKARTLRRRELHGYNSIVEIAAICEALDQHPAPVLFQANKDTVATTIAALLPPGNLEIILRIAEAHKANQP